MSVWHGDPAEFVTAAIQPHESVLSRRDLLRLGATDASAKLLMLGAALDKANAIGEPKWNRVAVPGKFYRPDFPGGSLDLDRAAFETMIANWKRMGGNALPVDRHHWGDSNDTRISAADKIAVGWMEDFRIAADGALESLIAWNDDGREDITKDRRRYVSPSFAPQAIDRRTGKSQGWTLYGAGLLNDPFLTELPRMAASAEPLNPNPALVAKEANMPKHLLAALALIGLTDSSTEADVTAAKELLEGERAKLAADKDEAVKLAASSGAGVEAMKIALAKESEARTALSAEVVKLQKAALDTAIATEGDRLFRAGKLKGAATARFVALAHKAGLAFAVEEYESHEAIDLSEKGHGTVEGEETPAGAFAKLQLAAEALATAGAPRGESMIRAMQANPALAKAAGSLTSPNRS